MFVFDTDHVIVAQWDSQPEARRLRNRMSHYNEADFYLTVVSVHEQLLGAHNAISRAKSREAMTRGYRLIESAMIYYNQFNILPFDEPAFIRFENLRQRGVRIGTMDLRIASIVLSHNFTLLTRNTVDFEKVPGLRVEDWTIGS